MQFHCLSSYQNDVERISCGSISAPLLAPLVHEADHSTQVRLRDYVIGHIFVDLDEEEPEDEDGK